MDGHEETVEKENVSMISGDVWIRRGDGANNRELLQKADSALETHVLASAEASEGHFWFLIGF